MCTGYQSHKYPITKTESIFSKQMKFNQFRGRLSQSEKTDCKNLFELENKKKAIQGIRDEELRTTEKDVGILKKNSNSIVYYIPLITVFAVNVRFLFSCDFVT